ncbi:MAG: sulfite oxidase [Pseudomonadota bacterium]
MKERPVSLPRRRMLQGSAALAAAGAAGWSGRTAAQAKPLPGYVSWKDAAAVIVHSPNTIETKRSAFGTSVITPASRLYIRNNVTPPEAAIVADRDRWQVAIEGVKSPRTLSVGELKAIGIGSLAMVLQCSGNGRGFYPHKPSGTKWTVGAAGCVVWSGAPVRAVVEALGGLVGDAKYMTGTGGEKIPAGIDPKSVIVQRSLPLAAMEDALLAWEMNGEPVSLAHGGPLRLIVPGYTGVNNIKYVDRLAFTATESGARIMATRYRMAPLGGKGAPSQPSVLAMSPKSWINSPNPENSTVRAGVVQVHGVAFGGLNGVRWVEVSVDGGENWQEAEFIGPDLGRYAWRQFVLPVQLKAGSYNLVCRTKDTDGNLQPRERPENAGGYNNNGWADHGVKLTVA